MTFALITTGTQLPFDRLVRAVDKWAQTHSDIEFLAQVGENAYAPENFESRAYIEGGEYQRLVKKSDLIISHAGMGSILAAIEWRKPIILFPRSHLLGEVRNAHQLATAQCFRSAKGIHVADDEPQLNLLLGRADSLESPDCAKNSNTSSLVNFVREFIHSERISEMADHITAAETQPPGVVEDRKA
ncbi:glycosyltransferase [Biformimicrobium ophioploci]|uniref:PssE/Cps14G family polysaccharide biosynthesis glycosyltransferase n=1 Tax=Biformimicrobium ophioploci TaxID=3036711 RepID=A0ABQ6M075_9GAMM|nr:glycosyltransferase [Microbulbifer sp. NKW57]GMG87753.1 PssE/Cps14G family polysaccharide biosynthesis glycosyltransferase [Microbulbifer sp. NKW57]